MTTRPLSLVNVAKAISSAIAKLRRVENCTCLIITTICQITTLLRAVTRLSLLMLPLMETNEGIEAATNIASRPTERPKAIYPTR